MKLLLSSLFLLVSILLFAQPKIEMEVNEYDFGQIIRGSNGNLEFKFTNTGDSVLIISRVRTGDGGSMAYQKTRRPIPAGESGIIVFKYDTKRIGPFRKSIDINSNAKRHGVFRGVRIKGEVILPPTKITLEKSSVDIGSIPYGTMKKAHFIMTNSGGQKLNIHALFSDYNYPENDIVYESLRSIYKPSADRYKRSFENGDKLSAEIAIRNVHGNSGYFTRKLSYKYNSHDTLWVTVTGTFTGGPTKKMIYEKHDELYYENSILVKRCTYGSQGTIVRKDYYRRSSCYKSERYDGSTGKINQVREYKDGVETKKTFFKEEEY